MTNDPWDDERLEAAYTARGEVHPTPGDLTASTMAAIRSGARPATVSRWPQILAAAAALAVVFGGLAFAGLGSRGPNPGASSVATAGATVEAPTATAPGPTPPAEVAGLPVISVSDAIAVRNASVDGRELAVRGWLTRGTGPNTCQGKPEPRSLVLSECDRYVWLTERPQTMRLPDGGVGGFDTGPDGPAFIPYLDEVDTSWLSPIPDRGGSTPQDVVLIGHFDDRRSTECPTDAESACRGRFVVDRVCWVDGTEVELSELNELGGPRASVDHDVATLVLEAAPQASILSALTVTGQHLAEIEPVFRTRDEYGLTSEAGVWVIHTAVDGQPVTYLVVDGTRRAYLMTPDGGVDFIGDPATSSAGPQETWPPAGATMVEVPGVEVAVVDASGRLRGAREGAPDPSSLGGDLGTKPASLFATTTPGELLLTWPGSGCDRRAIVTIDEALSAIAVERIETPSCEGEARLFGLLLTFDSPVDPSGITVSATHRVMPTP